MSGDEGGIRQFNVGYDDDGIRLDRWFRRRWPHLSNIQVQKVVRDPQKPMPAHSISLLRWLAWAKTTPSSRHPSMLATTSASSCQRSRAPGMAPPATRARSRKSPFRLRLGWVLMAERPG